MIAVLIGATAVGSAVVTTATTADAAYIPYGVIVASRSTGYSIISRNYESYDAALAAALARCGSDCKVYASFSGHGACGALAQENVRGSTTPWTRFSFAGAWGPSLADAEFNARRKAGNGRLIVSGCNN